MELSIIIVEAVIFAIIFTISVFVMGKKYKHTPAWIFNYPKDIQDEYFKTHERVDVSGKSPKVILTKSVALMIFTLILFTCSYLAGAKTFWQGFILTFGLMAWIGLYDTLFLDWVVFANLKMFRLEGTEHMDKAYHQKWFHLKGMLFPGIVFAVIPSVLVGGLIMVI